MPGQRVSIAGKRLDVVLVAARYSGDGKLALARGFERRGDVWGDVVLLTREVLVEKLRAVRHVVTGQPRELPGDFAILAPVRLETSPTSERIVAEGLSSEGEDLGLPLF
jgi:hypothetical protein